MARVVVDRTTLNLPMKIEPLIASIEKSFARSVVFAKVDDLLHAEASGGLDDNGTPWVCMMPQGCREITIVHELLHLECEAQGFPRTRSAIGTAKLPPDKVCELIGEWFSIVEHRVIYPKMVMLGYDPSRDLDSKARKLLSDLENKAVFLNKNPNRDVLFVDLVTQVTRVLTECTRSIRKLFINTMKASFPEELEISIRLADQIKFVKNWNPKEVRGLAENCLADIGIPRVVYHYIPPVLN